MNLYVFATLTEAEAALLTDLLPSGAPHLDQLRQKLTPATVPQLPATALVLHPAHILAPHQVILLLAPVPRPALQVLRRTVYTAYLQTLSEVPLHAAHSVAALGDLLRAANGDDR